MTEQTTGSIRDKFNEAEWGLLTSAPIVAGLAVSVADETGFIGMAKEMTANARAYVEGGRHFNESALIPALAQSPNKEALESLKPASGEDRRAFVARTRERAVTDCKNAVALIEERLDSAEAGFYRAWILDIAERVKKSSDAGGFLGIGGVQVSPDEQAMVDELRTLLEA
jgi:hypothetical protein